MRDRRAGERPPVGARLRRMRGFDSRLRVQSVEAPFGSTEGAPLAFDTQERAILREASDWTVETS